MYVDLLDSTTHSHSSRLGTLCLGHWCICVRKQLAEKPFAHLARQRASDSEKFGGDMYFTCLVFQFLM